MSNLEIDGYNNCNVYGNNYGKHDFEPMNKLHEALKNEELMLEVGRKATEEQIEKYNFFPILTNY